MIQTREIKKLSPAETALKTNEALIRKLKRQQTQSKVPEPVKKKAEVQHEKKYPLILEVASLVVCLLLCASLLVSVTGFDLVGAWVAFVDSMDLFKDFDGGQPLAPSDYVMHINN